MNNILFQNINNRDIFINDNLSVMRKMENKCIDLIYLDPPFGNMLTWEAKSKEKIKEIKDFFVKEQKEKGLFLNENFEEIFKNVKFSDEWEETDVNKTWQEEIIIYNEKLFEFIDKIDFSAKGGKYYLFFMAIRLIEMKRILKDTGSIYLHCNETMGHYLKTIMDFIFGYNNFRNNIEWCYNRFSRTVINAFPSMNDIILFYSKTKKSNFNKIYTDYKSNSRLIKGYHVLVDKGIKKLLVYDHLKAETKIKEYEKKKLKIIYTKSKKPVMNNIWNDISYINSQAKERVGYPTQKPLELLKRIIKVSSNEGDIVLDPFCGCATTLISAELLNRKWIGIDKNEQAFYMNYYRMRTQINTTENITKNIQGSFLDNNDENIKEKKDITTILINEIKKPRLDLPILDNKEKDNEINQKIKESKKLDDEYLRKIEEENKQLSQKEKEEYKKELLEKQFNKCQICKTKIFEGYHLDRIVPGAKKGKYVVDNLQVLCSTCNLSKNNKSNIDFIIDMFKNKKYGIDILEINLKNELNEKRITEQEFNHYKKEYSF